MVIVTDAYTGNRVGIPLEAIELIQESAEGCVITTLAGTRVTALEYFLKVVEAFRDALHAEE